MEPRVNERPPPRLDPSRGPLLPRLANALLLRKAFYDAVAADPRATGPAGAVVCLAAIARESVGIYEISKEYKAWGLLLVIVAVFAVVRWVAYAAVLYPIARWLSGRRFGYVRLLRCLGFAETPAVMTIVAVALPERFTPHVSFVVGAWLLLATIVAVRAATEVSPARAVAIGVLGFATYLALGAAIDYATSSIPPPPGAVPAVASVPATG
jgi:hypothetical protein